MRRRPVPDRPGPGQQSVWDFPRPPALVHASEHVRVEFAGHVVADGADAVVVCETSHPPVYYLHPRDVDAAVLEQVALQTWCEFKGQATYYDLVVGSRRSASACWSYPQPTEGYEALAGRLTFYPQRVDRITVDGDPVRSVEGDFYGGWITSWVTGPFKGGPGTQGW